MGLWQRFTMIFKAKASKALDKAEDPRETLDYSYEKQLELLQKVRRGVADVATSRKRIELQMTNLGRQADKLQEQAKAALAGGREDLAREALTRRSGLQQQIGVEHRPWPQQNHFSQLEYLLSFCRSSPVNNWLHYCSCQWPAISGLIPGLLYTSFACKNLRLVYLMKA